MKGTTMVRKQERMTVLLVLGLVAAGPTRPCTAAAPEKKSAVNAVTAGELVVERPTLICLGFQWYTSNDANKNAQVTLQYRKLGEQAWKPALDPWRLCGQRCISYGGEEHDFYEPPQMFAGSIFDLQPDTSYECRLSMSDPDGVSGEATRTVTVKTRAEPQPPADSRVLHLGGGKADFPDFREAVRASSRAIRC